VTDLLEDGKKCVEKAKELMKNKQFKEAVNLLRKEGIGKFRFHGAWLLLKDPILLQSVTYTEEELKNEGTAGAIWFLGRAYGYGYHTIVGDAEKAFQSFCDAVKLDPTHGFAWLYHARCLRAGYGVAENQEEAYESYKKAAALGVALAYNEIGDGYRDGTTLGLNVDLARARDNYAIGAKLLDPDSAKKLHKSEGIEN